MKKIVMIALVACAVMVSCNSSATKGCSDDCDSTLVDSTLVDTVAVDSATVDTVAVDSVFAE